MCENNIQGNGKIRKANGNNGNAALGSDIDLMGQMTSICAFTRCLLTKSNSFKLLLLIYNRILDGSIIQSLVLPLKYRVHPSLAHKFDKFHRIMLKTENC